jgi:hypothetical protein
MSKVLGSTGHPDTATYVSDQGAEPTAAAQWIVFEEIFGAADRIESLAIGLKEAARRSDQVRVHSYFADIVEYGAALRSADARLTALEKLGGQQ